MTLITGDERRRRWSEEDRVRILAAIEEPAALPSALANLREGWEAETTARNLSLIREVGAEAGKDVTRLASIIGALEATAKG